jgi:mannonate dehydratase
LPRCSTTRPRKIFEVIRWFGERAKIFKVHFRNIKGRKLDFMEAFPDEGDTTCPARSP